MPIDRAECVVRLRRAVGSFGEPPEQQWEEFARLFRRSELAKGEHLIHAGARPTTLAFLAEGLLRIYYTRRDGKEFNKSFVCPPDFVAALDALVTGSRSSLSIQALEQTTLLVADYERVIAFYERDMYWQRLGRLFVERLYAKKVRKEAAFLMQSAAERYAAFLADHADVHDRIADYHVASYLGITPEALSRLKRRRVEKSRS